MKKQTAATYRTSLTGSRGNPTQHENPGIFSTVGKYRKNTSYTGSWASSPGTVATLLTPIQSYDQYHHCRTTFARRPFPFSSFRPSILSFTRQSDYIQELQHREERRATILPDTPIPIVNASFDLPVIDNNDSETIRSVNPSDGWVHQPSFTIARGNSINWPIISLPPAPYTQYAVLRSTPDDPIDIRRSFYQNITFAVGTYTMYLWTIAIENTEFSIITPNTITVEIDGEPVYSFTPVKTEWRRVLFEFTISDPGEKQVLFIGINPAGLEVDARSALTGIELYKHNYCGQVPIRYTTTACGQIEPLRCPAR